MPEDNRDILILKMYDQLWNNINRHINIPWQSITVLISVFAVYSIVEKNIISVDSAASIIILISTWQIIHVYDASLWVNRNLTIITNIEKQYLLAEDIKGIHFYFSRHRDNKMLDIFQLQASIGYAVAILILIYHFYYRITPLFSQQSQGLSIRWVPYVVAILAALIIESRKQKSDKAFDELLKKSPGIDIKEYVSR